jgi:hypothetical protein
MKNKSMFFVALKPWRFPGYAGLPMDIQEDPGMPR